MTDVTMAESLIEKIASAAPQVAAEYEANQSAIQAERAAEAAVLEKALAVAKPALAALSGRIVKSERTFWVDNVSTDTEVERFDERGFVLCGSGPERDYPRANRGAYEGTRLYLLSDGRLAHVTYSGSWSKWQGEGTRWDAEMKILTPAEAMVTWDLDDVIAGLAEAVEKQAGSREERTQAAKARVAKLAAITTLVR